VDRGGITEELKKTLEWVSTFLESVASGEREATPDEIYAVYSSLRSIRLKLEGEEDALPEALIKTYLGEEWLERFRSVRNGKELAEVLEEGAGLLRAKEVEVERCRPRKGTEVVVERK